MSRFHLSRGVWILILGDLGVLFLVTVFGFARHGSLNTTGGRFLTTFLPVVAAWFLVAPGMGCFSEAGAKDYRQLWRPFLAMVIAGPLAAFFRSLLLQGAPILPVFVVVLGGVSALGILAWRMAFCFLRTKKG